MQCEVWRDAMLDVLYGEADADTVKRVEEHQGQCSSCRDEMASFRKVRKNLSAWSLPEQRLGRRAPTRPWFLHGWAAAAAIVLAGCGALALAGAEVRIENRSLVFRVGAGARPDEVRALLA